MKSKIGKFLLATGGYVFYLLSAVLAALLLFVFEFLKNFFEKGTMISFSETFNEMTREKSSVVLLISYVIVVIAVFSFLKVRRKNIGAYTGFSNVYPLGIFGAIVFGSVLNFTIFSIVSPDASGKMEITALFMLCIIISPFAEELVFRGVLLRIFGKVCGAMASILITSLLFAISHTDQVQMVYAFILGAVLCVVRIRSGSLWNAVALHFAFNLSGTVLATSELEFPEIAFVVIPILAVLSFALACSGKRKVRGK